MINDMRDVKSVIGDLRMDWLPGSFKEAFKNNIFELGFKEWYKCC